MENTPQLIECPVCQGKVSSDAPACPHNKMNIEATELFKALKDQPAHEPPKPVTTEQKVEVANELHDWLKPVANSNSKH